MKEKIMNKLKAVGAKIKANVANGDWWVSVLQKLCLFLTGAVLGEIIGYIRCGKETEKYFDEHMYISDDGNAYEVHIDCFDKEKSWIKPED
jgi:hypothetical protein